MRHDADDIEEDGLDSPRARAEDAAHERKVMVKAATKLAQRPWTARQMAIAKMFAKLLDRHGVDLVLDPVMARNSHR